MKRLLAVTLLLFFMIPASALANSVSVYLDPNCCGENFFFDIRGPGLDINGLGGTPFGFFDFIGYSPGFTLGGFTDLFFSDGSATLDGVSDEVFWESGTLFMSNIVLPTNGRDFRAPVELDFSASGVLASTGNPIGAGGGATGYIKFDFSKSDGLYYAESFVEAPEPWTLGLVGTGLIAIFAGARIRAIHP